MDGDHLVAIYPNLADAEHVSQQLIREGIRPNDIRLTRADTRHGARHDFVNWLMGTSIPERERERYAAHFRDGRAALTVIAPERRLRDRSIAIMEAGNPIDIDDPQALAMATSAPEVKPPLERVDDGSSKPTQTAEAAPAPIVVERVPPERGRTTESGPVDIADRRPAERELAERETVARKAAEPEPEPRPAASAAPAATLQQTARRPDEAATRTGPAGATRPAEGMQFVEEESVIPVVKEEVVIGKRVEERRFRVRTYVVERPVEQQVMLRDERIEIERRPTGRTAIPADLQRHGDLEIVERHERPVVEKRTSVEEVVVRKGIIERPETVRATVRETRVEVEPETTEAKREPAVEPARA